MLYPPVLERAIRSGATNPPGKSHWHGEEHWKGVALVGFYLVRTAFMQVDLESLLIFAALHDVMRENEWDDPMHGQRAARLWERFVETAPGVDGYESYSQRAMEVYYAIAYHVTETHPSPDLSPLAAVCWDADRLCRYRLGGDEAPDDRYLTLDVSKTPAAKMCALHWCSMQINGQPFPAWSEIMEEMQTWRYP